MQDDDDENCQEPRRVVSDCCAICLECYKEGETVVWSASEECRHVYHQACFVDYLLAYKFEGSPPCPSCRENFCEL
jgi:hypothetical protein